MKSIKQIADGLGVSKQAVYKRVKGSLRTVVAPYAHTIDGVLYIEEQGETLINQAFKKNAVANTYGNRSMYEHTEYALVCGNFQSNLNVLHEQLAEKDKQIASRDKTIEDLSAMLISAQERRGLFARFFGGKKRVEDVEP